MKHFDVAIIGAGITGCAIARELAKYELTIALIDARDDVGMGASRANSAIVHAGYDCPPGSLMARLNVRGNALFEDWCRELRVPLRRTGSLVVAFGAEEERAARELYERGLKNGVPGLKLISGDEAREMEPRLSKKATLALYAPTAGIACPFDMTLACAENARDNGAEWLLGKPVAGVELGKEIILTLGDERISASRVIDAAGVRADEVARLIGDESFSISPRKGEYLLFDRDSLPMNTVVFQTPTAMGKGVLVAPTIHGNAYLGPTAVNTSDKDDTSVSQESIDALKALAEKSVPGINTRNVIREFAGVRAQPSTGDFIIRPSEIDARFIFAAGICSPGFTSAPAIAQEVAGIVGLTLTKKRDYNPIRPAIPHFAQMDDAERERAIAENPLFGRVICRCCTVTEAEIVLAIKRGARDVDAVKRRTGSGMGRCQGGFCTPRIMEIISRETGIAADKITKFGGKSYLTAGYTRGEAVK